MLKIQKIKWHNFMSWGNDWNSLDFTADSRLTLLVGRNGAGKSSLSNGVMTFALYGKLNEVNLSDIPNRVNGNLETSVEVLTKEGLLVVERGLKPSYLRVYRDGKEITTAGKVNIEKWLVDAYGMSQSMFENVAALSVNTFKSLLTFAPKDRREIFDNLFGYGCLNTIGQNLKDLNKRIVIDKEKAQAVLTNAESSLRAVAGTELYTASHTQADVEAKRKEYEEAYGKEKDLRESIGKAETMINEGNTTLRGQETAVSELQARLRELENKIALYDKGVCPLCGSDLTSDEHKGFYESLLKEKAEVVSEIEGGKVKIAEHREKLNKLTEKVREAQNNAQAYRIKGDVAKRDAEQYEAEIANAERAEEKRKSLLAEFEHSIKEQSDAIALADKRKSVVDKAVFLCSDNGLKKVISERYLPVLNDFMARSARELSVPVQITFNNDYSCSIRQLGEEIPFKSLSSGERKKASVAALLAFVRLLRVISAGGCNLLFLDEVFSSLDIESVEALLGILKDFAEENSLNIFVVHHAAVDSERADEVIEVRKTNGFSSMAREIPVVNE